MKQDSEGLRSVGDGKSEILPESSVEERISKVAERPIAGAENNLEESSSVFEISDNSMVRLSNAAATTINSVARGHLDRSKVSSMQKNLVEEHAATEIAARCRGYLVRKNHAQNKKMPVLQEEGKSLVETEEEKESVQDEYSGYLMGQGWIQYSTEHGDVYYYNKITHVSQWNCPEIETEKMSKKRPPPPPPQQPHKLDTEAAAETVFQPSKNGRDDEEVAAEREYRKDQEMLNILNIACKSLKGQETLSAALVLEQRLYLKAKMFNTVPDQPPPPSILKLGKTLCKQYNTLAMRSLKHDDFELTKHLLDRGLELTGSKSLFLDASFLSHRIVTLNNLACCYRKQGLLDKSLLILKEAIEFGTETIHGDAEHISMCFLNRCSIYSQLSEHEKAMEDAQFAIFYSQESIKDMGPSSLDPKTMSERVVALAAGYYNLAVQLEFTGRFELCLQWYQKACTLARVHCRKRDDTRLRMERALASAELAYGKKKAGKRRKGRPSSARRYAGVGQRKREWKISKVEPISYAKDKDQTLASPKKELFVQLKPRSANSSIFLRSLSTTKRTKKKGTGSAKKRPRNRPQSAQMKARAGKSAAWDDPDRRMASRVRRRRPNSARNGSSGAAYESDGSTDALSALEQDEQDEQDNISHEELSREPERKKKVKKKKKTSVKKKKVMGTKKKVKAKIKKSDSEPVVRNIFRNSFANSPTRMKEKNKKKIMQAATSEQATKRVHAKDVAAFSEKEDEELDAALDSLTKSRQTRRKLEKSRAKRRKKKLDVYIVKFQALWRRFRVRKAMAMNTHDRSIDLDFKFALRIIESQGWVKHRVRTLEGPMRETLYLHPIVNERMMIVSQVLVGSEMSKTASSTPASPHLVRYYFERTQEEEGGLQIWTNRETATSPKFPAAADLKRKVYSVGDPVYVQCSGWSKAYRASVAAVTEGGLFYNLMFEDSSPFGLTLNNGVEELKNVPWEEITDPDEIF